MPPQLALLVTVIFVVFLFRWEDRNGGAFSQALWIPLLWILVTGSRFISQWTSTLFGVTGTGSYEEGSLLDALFFLGLIVAGLAVLARRQVKLSDIVKNNRWLSVFFLYCFLAVFWSDFPFVAFKRWIKVLGHPIMALVILTESDPSISVRGILARAAFVLVPFSVTTIKYFPHIGRGFDAYGSAQNQGLNLNKNELGYCCLIFGLYFFWRLLQARQLTDGHSRRYQVLVSLVLLVMICWLLYMARSATSLACLIIGCCTVVFLGMSWVNPKHLAIYLILGALVYGAAEMSIGIYANVVKTLGRDPTLTDRTEVWADVFSLVDNPLIGTGFESFWLGERREKLWAKWWWQPNQAHNGYIETYLNLGVIGVVLLVAMIVATFKKAQNTLLRDFEFGRLRMAFLIVILAYNYTEATFKAVHLIWSMFTLIAMDVPSRARLHQSLSSRYSLVH